MQILSVSVVFPPAWHHGGTPITAHAVAKAMIQQGNDVLALCTGDKETDGSPVVNEEIEWNGVPVIYCSRTNGLMPFYSPTLKREVATRVNAFDVTTIRSSWTHVGPAASRECRDKGVSYLAYPEGNFDSWALRQGRLKKNVFWTLFDKAFFQGAGAIVALTRSEADSIRKMGLTNKVEVIPNGVNVGDFIGGCTRADLETIYPAIRNRILVLFMSRIHPKKGLHNLITAFQQLRVRHPDALLLIAGPDENNHRKEVELHVQQKNLGENVLFVGQVSGDVKIGLLKNSAVFVLPSYSEGFPVVVLEALACKLPVVLTKHCHVPEVAEAGAGIEVDISAPQIANALDRLLSDDLARTQMGENGYQLAVERFSWDRVAKMTVELCSIVS